MNVEGRRAGGGGRRGPAGADLAGIELVGLMAMPPLAATLEDEADPGRVAGLAADHGLAGLSMGTSADFEVAIGGGDRRPGLVAALGQRRRGRLLGGRRGRLLGRRRRRLSRR